MKAFLGGLSSTNQTESFVEAYGLLLASILLGSNGKPPQMVAVVAAQSGDGCSTTAANLALMMARTGRRTLLVDGNIRAPVLHQACGRPQSPGLSEVLTGKTQVQDAIVPTAEENLSLLAAGELNVPAQIIYSQSQLAEVLHGLRERSQLTVIDTPPLLKYSDALHIAKVVDGVLVVVPSQGALRRDQQEMRRLLDRVDARILGTVLNRARGSHVARP